jgi:hypothetical protein
MSELPYMGLLEKSQPNSTIALNAVATILVRNVEVVAVSCQVPAASISQADGKTDDETPFQVLAVQEHDEEPWITRPDTSVPTSFTALANPGNATQQLEPLYVQSASGKSRWPAISQNSWICLDVG